MVLTQDQKDNTSAVIASIWGGNIANNIRINEDVVIVVDAALEAISLKSKIIKDFLLSVMDKAGGRIPGIVGYGFKIAQFILEKCWTGSLNAARITVAAQYRTPLEMASNGLGVWV